MRERLATTAGNFLPVDHALSRAERGLVGVLKVDGPENPEVFEPDAPTKDTAMAH